MLLRSLPFLLMAFAALPAAAFDDPDWPCEQRKVRHLSWGQMWTGPILPEGDAWREDADIAALAVRLSARKTAVEEADGLIERAGIAGDARLSALFAGAFALIDAERARLVDGIERLSRKERERRDRIDALRGEIDMRSKAAASDDYDELDAIEALEDTLAWETRIYQDRRRSLTFVCESPVLLEKRAFALARVIQARLP